MATPYTDIYDSFLGKISDYSFVNLTESELKNILIKFMNSAIPEIERHFPAGTFNRNDLSQEFVSDLSKVQIKIISRQMIVEWLSPALYTSELIKQIIPDKDFKIYSQANHLKELQSLKDSASSEVQSLITSSSYYNDSLEGLT